MKGRKRLRKFAVDANPILSAVLGGKAHALFTLPTLEFHTTEHTMREAISKIPGLAEKLRAKKVPITATDLYFALVVAPIEIHQREFYEDRWEAARKRIGKRDPDDVDLLALALKLSIPVWTNDKDYSVAGVRAYTTAKLLKKLRIRPA